MSRRENLEILGLKENASEDEIKNLSPEAIHIDTTFMPLAPGKVLINPEWIDVNQLPDILKKWDILFYTLF